MLTYNDALIEQYDLKLRIVAQLQILLRILANKDPEQVVGKR
jgi:hypothetical protein